MYRMSRLSDHLRCEHGERARPGRRGAGQLARSCPLGPVQTGGGTDCSNPSSVVDASESSFER